MKDLVIVEWFDSSYTAGWTRDEVQTKCTSIRSVGWIASRNRNAVVLVSHQSMAEISPQRCNIMTIPACAIFSIRKAKAGKQMLPIKAKNKPFFKDMA